MEESENKNEENFRRSLGLRDDNSQNEEITEPHVKQIISAFGGKKLYREDIDKFKQLESTFRRIAQLEDGESILRKHTEEMTQTVISGASMQINNGTVSIGQVATIILNRSEEVYQINKELEDIRLETTNKPQEAEQEKPEIATEVKTEEEKEESQESSGYFETQEEFDKFINDYFNFFEGLGVELSEEDKAIVSEELGEVNQEAQKRNANGELESPEAAELMTKMKDAKTREELIEAAESGMNYFENRAQLMRKYLEEISGPEGEADVLPITPEEAERKIERYERMVEYFKECRERLIREPNCRPEEIFGANVESIKEYIKVQNQMDELKKEGKEKTEEYEKLKVKKSNLMTFQETRELNKVIAVYQASIDQAKAVLENSTNEEERKNAKAKIERQTKKLCLIISRRDKLKRKVSEIDDSFKMENFDDEESPKHIFKLKEDGEVVSRTDMALEYAKNLNSMYIDKDGKTSFLEHQMASMGKSSALMGERNVSQIAVEELTTKFERIYGRLMEGLSLERDEEQRAEILKRMNKVKGIFQRELIELNISQEYRKELVSLYSSVPGQLNPEEVQIISWKSAISLGESKGSNTDVSREILSRLEKNKGVFDDMLSYIVNDPSKHRYSEEIADALLKTMYGTSETYSNLLKATNENEMIQTLLDFYDKNVADSSKFDNSIRNHVESILRNVCSERGKDGLLTVFENKTVTRDYMRTMKKTIRASNVIKDNYAHLKDDEKIVIEDGSGDKDNPNILPDFINPNSKMYVEMMLSLRREHLSEEQITSTLIQIDPGAARDAYALYELLVNKKALEDPQLGESQKAELRDRNKKILDMMFVAYKNRIEKEKLHNEKQVERETDPSIKESFEKIVEDYDKRLKKAEEQSKTFDIEKLSIRMPDETKINEEHKKREAVARRVKKVFDGKPRVIKLKAKKFLVSSYKTSTVDEKGEMSERKKLATMREMTKKTFLSRRRKKNRDEIEEEINSPQEAPIQLGNVIESTKNDRIEEINDQARLSKAIITMEQTQGKEDEKSSDAVESQSL